MSDQLLATKQSMDRGFEPRVSGTMAAVAQLVEPGSTGRVPHCSGRSVVRVHPAALSVWFLLATCLRHARSGKVVACYQMDTSQSRNRDVSHHEEQKGETNGRDVSLFE